MDSNQSIAIQVLSTFILGDWKSLTRSDSLIPPGQARDGDLGGLVCAVGSRHLSAPNRDKPDGSVVLLERFGIDLSLRGGSCLKLA